MDFMNALVQQLVLFMIFVFIAVCAVFIGIAFRKHKDKKDANKKSAEKKETITE